MSPDTPTEQAVRALDRLHERLLAEPIEASTERADQAMYRAKTGGRKRTVVALE